MLKKCSKCNSDKPIDEFSWKDKKNNRRSSECKDCHRKYRDAYYKNNKKKEIKRVHRRRQELLEWFSNLKKTWKCSRCSEDHPAALQLHHRDPSEKEGGINLLIRRRGWSIEKILEEIKKCEVLCANCHFKEHWRG